MKRSLAGKWGPVFQELEKTFPSCACLSIKDCVTVKNITPSSYGTTLTKYKKQHLKYLQEKKKNK